MSRQSAYTQPATYADREAEWKKSIEATHKHIKYGAYLQKLGVNLLESLGDISDPEQKSKLLAQSLAHIEHGIAVERDGQRELSELLQSQPRE